MSWPKQLSGQFETLHRNLPTLTYAEVLRVSLEERIFGDLGGLARKRSSSGLLGRLGGLGRLVIETRCISECSVSEKTVAATMHSEL